jgi:uncharacterized protein (DUF2249 family)
MLYLNANTKIAAIIKQHPGALEAIISISPKFEKLRNPILRKLMAGRASISMACNMAGCSIDSFYDALKPLGFEIDEFIKPVAVKRKELPSFLTTLQQDNLIALDVRPLLASGKDPLTMITEKVKTIKAGEVLKIINTFEPLPLMKLLEKQGFEMYADVVNDNLVETYFYKSTATPINNFETTDVASNGWEEILNKFAGKLQTIDVRLLEMPLPMHNILEALYNLPGDNALFVYHKRIPVFLLPELTERKFDYRIKEISDGEVHLLIFKA